MPPGQPTTRSAEARTGPIIAAGANACVLHYLDNDQPCRKGDLLLLDVAAAAGAAKAGGKVGVVGYCLGGTLAWLAAAKVGGLAAAVGYYGGGVPALGALRPRVPVMLHFVELDAHIPLDGVRAFAAAQPDTPVFTYPTGGHAFNRYGNAAYDAPSATLARQRTLAFFGAKLG